MQSRRTCHSRSDHGARNLFSTKRQCRPCSARVDIPLCLPVFNSDQQRRGEDFRSVEVACGSSSAMYKRLSKGLLRGRRSRPGHNHAGAPARRGLGGVEYSKDARGRFGGGIRHSISAQRMAPLTRTQQTTPAPPQPAPAQAPLLALPAAGRRSRIRTCANCAPSATRRRNRGPCRTHRTLAGPRRGLRG